MSIFLNQQERAIDREEDELRRELDEGVITLAQYNKALRELQRDYRAAAEEAGRDAYEREVEKW